MSSEIPYSPIQPPSDHVKPGIKDFPPVVERVSQQVDPFADVLELEIPRVTYQGNDRCNLRCPGCYANEWLLKDGDHRVANSSSLVELDLFDEHMDALGPDLTELYALGAELTAAPDHSRELMKRAANRGLAIMAITNGARRPEVVDSTLESGLESGEIYKLNISLDSTNSEVNDQLRGKKGASEATLETIRRYAEKDYPIRVQMTVWPLNYATIMDSVKELYDNYGVRGFSFHCGSLEGVQGRNAELEKVGGSCLEPLAWRSLTDRLLEFNESHYEDIKFFYVPYIYFTEQELSDYVIGDDDLMQEYIEHNAEVEKGNPQPLPFNACPGIDVPQVYLYANDKTANGSGKVSACNMDSGAHNRFVAEYDVEAKRFKTVQDPKKNQINGMINSPHLCPAVEAVTGGSNPNGSDRFETEEGDLYHACRYISNNQMPVGSKLFPRAIYERFAAQYRAQFLTDS